MIGKLNHVGVATPSIDESLKMYRDLLGATSVTEKWAMPEQGVWVCFVNLPNSQIELIEPTSPDSAVGKWLAANPLGGQHHLCYEVPDIHEAKAWFESQGKRVLGEPRIGAHGTLIFFVHPKDMGGQLTEIMEVPNEAH
ncbi:MAG: methylmalonyl-CoA epimerase [Sphingomonadales bacterium 39-62-4]|nr:MAG: methylmalonyl-CoA epimerase [Sphingomonadales bacterium 39-62-4]